MNKFPNTIKIHRVCAHFQPTQNLESTLNSFIDQFQQYGDPILHINVDAQFIYCPRLHTKFIFIPNLRINGKTKNGCFSTF